MNKEKTDGEMMNVLGMTPVEARAGAIRYIRVQEFRNRNFRKGEGGRAIPCGLQITLFTAARHLVTAEPGFREYTGSLSKRGLEAL